MLSLLSSCMPLLLFFGIRFFVQCSHVTPRLVLLCLSLKVSRFGSEMAELDSEIVGAQRTEEVDDDVSVGCWMLDVEFYLGVKYLVLLASLLARCVRV